MQSINLSVATVVVWSLCTAATQAEPVTYSFSAIALEGPLAGGVETGLFTFEESIIPVGGGLVEAVGLLTDLDFRWNGITYDETNANTGTLIFEPNGELRLALFGSDCSPSCFLLSNTNGFIFGAGVGRPGEFSYTVAGFNLVYHANISRITGLGPPVPEPATAALVALAIGWATFRRRKHGPGPV
jgi:hypothetical protein